MRFRTSLSLVVLAALAASALALEAVRLLVELPKDLTTIEAGDAPIDVQIVARDAGGGRGAATGKTVEVSATQGELALVEAPYKYRYTPPATIDAATPAKLRAWLKQNPDVNGEATLTILPRRPFERLVLVAPATSVVIGKTMQVEVRGVKADGTTVATSGQNIKMTVEGAGSVAPNGPGIFTFTAPAKTETQLVGATAHLRATLATYPRVRGDLSIVIAPEPPVEQPAPPVPPKPNTPPGTPPTTPPTNPPTNPPTPPKADDGVVWPGGDLKLVEWRWKTGDPKEIWSQQPKRKLPPSGKPLIAPLEYQFVKLQVLREDVRKYDVEWYTDRKGAVVHTDDADKEGRLSIRKDGGKTYVVLLMATPGEANKSLFVDLLLTLADGKIVKVPFVLQRGRDKDDDGTKDGKK